MIKEEKFELWCVVELFGHAKIAGKCTEQNIAGTNMLRVDVPETQTQAAFTRFLGAGAIYTINPVDEATARYYASRLETKLIDPWDVKEMLRKIDRLQLELRGETPEQEIEKEIPEDDYMGDNEF